MAVHAAAPPRILSLPARPDAGMRTSWFERAAELGFSHVLAPATLLDEGVDAVGTMSRICHDHGLGLLLDVDVALPLPADAPLRAEHPEWFQALPDLASLPDPRRPAAEAGVRWRLHDDGVAPEALAWWCERLRDALQAGLAGLRLLSLDAAPAAWWAHLIDGLHAKAPRALLLGWTQGLSPAELAPLAGIGFDFAFCSAEWWDFRAGWLARELRRLAEVAPPLACAAAPFGDPAADRGFGGRELAQHRRRAAWFAGCCASGWLMPAGFERDEARGVDLTVDIRAINDWLRGLGAQSRQPVAIHIDDAWVGVLRRQAERAWVALLNARLDTATAVDPGAIAGGATCTYGDWTAPDGAPVAGSIVLAAGEVRILEGTQTRPIATRTGAAAHKQALAAATQAPRIAIEAVTPCVDDGRFAIKRVVGDVVTVEADVFMDGHDKLAVALRWRALDEKQWHELRMEPLGNDRYRGRFTPTRMGRHEYTVQAWRDAYASYRHEIVAKHDAGVPIALEMREGQHLVEQTAAGTSPARRKALRALASALAKAEDDEKRYRLLIDQATAKAMAEGDLRAFAVEHPPLRLEVDRRAAQFASWYELFPRSITEHPERHGTFGDVIGRLPAIREMGFDVLYFPPIHPIGRAFRKGRNNTLTPDEHDPGSPYAIGSAEGGHTAIHPELGSIEDFRALRDAARAQGLELALDFAIQCSPDHPWLAEHPEWFDWRPDGSLRYAENPPKKYQDIVNVDFYEEGAIPSLWQALCDVVLYWAGEGVRTFRVDNPHTKPFPFWEWMIARVRSEYPDALFLSEAFTRPKPMYRLAKLGFSQSYTYFTWRHTKQEFTDYLIELTQGPPRDFFRPNFFVNTPDINPYFLQQSGRTGFLIRAALATMLSGLWGMYSGFELCEAVPIPGKEEYLDSEKYEIKPRDWNTPGNIIAEITQLNAIRREQPALQSHLNVRFLRADNEQVLFFEKTAPGGRDRVLVAINLDPHHAQAADLHLPLDDWSVAEDAPLTVEDLLHDATLTWRGRRQHVWLGQGMPYAIWRVEA
ncbi:alpha-1,4-glucan--maltose-1-phosphate maltosyltransferase [Frateuria terrea]|uniref:Alpha-1,4-glucan:maltose-1-phosphate maltosyltransferase n=1 Tax=Frateuria terrea TaxID=529704 RepID=A0A1H6UDT8_9GAMM|nr:alpha-1,4-glucan--maltose-1-phosphate maltosyltransferase [Frateuria terrea]SEI90568.1 starch synthase (maltosyl-transferring) [Frateuria terrea]SFP36439.1 starch synthase (maltosyl-transferring) [Frateuria terrea]